MSDDFIVTRVGEKLDVSFSGRWLRGLSIAQAESFAANLDAVAIPTGGIMLDLDQYDPVEIRRRGDSVVVSVGQISPKTDDAKQRAILSFGVAKLLASRIRKAIAEPTSMSAVDVEKLLEDLELGGDENV